MTKWTLPERLALFSDIHGNLPALRAVLADIEARGLDDAYCLGDLVGYGPDPNGVIDLMRERDMPSLLGNYDQGVGGQTGDCGCFYPDREAKDVGKASYAFTVAAVTADRKAYLRDLPREAHIRLGEASLHLVHGSPRRINEYLLQERDARTYERLAAGEVDDVLAFGHTHQAWQRRYGGVLFVNDGTVGRPQDGDPRAGYVILSAARPGTDPVGAGVEVEFVRVDYEFESVASAIIAAGLPAPLADGIRAGK